MAFTSYVFWIFLIIVLFIYWFARKSKWQNIVLLAASFIFYGWFNPLYLVLLFVSISFDFLIARTIQNGSLHKKALLVLSIILNISILVFFKFAAPFYNTLLSVTSGRFPLETPGAITILLPIGLSFYTLRKISYMIDLYRGALPKAASLIDYALYVSFFPQLVSGPIDRAQKLLPQFQAERKWKWDNFYQAWPLFIMGLFKKIFVANSIKNIVDNIYSLREPGFLLFLVGTLGFMIEILADFSAYTDLARGTAYLFGMEASENFNSPYLATSPNDFWNRWHITLSNWLKDYVFFPVRRSILRNRPKLQWLATLIPPITAMLISGIWHGTGWTFIVWGLYWGILIVLYQLFSPKKPIKKAVRLRKILAWGIMFILIFFSWAIFRAYSVSWLTDLVTNFSLLKSDGTLTVIIVSLSLMSLYTIPWLMKKLVDLLPKKLWIVEMLYYAAAAILIIVYSQPNTPDFIYFQF